MWMNRYNKNLLNDDWFNDSDLGNRHCLRPHADLEQNENDYRLYIEMPGVSKEDIQIEVEEGLLKVSGEKKNHADEKLENLNRERCYGKFSRAFRLGRGIDSDNIQVEFSNGLLQIILPRLSENRKRSIAIN